MATGSGAEQAPRWRVNLSAAAVTMVAVCPRANDPPPHGVVVQHAHFGGPPRTRATTNTDSPRNELNTLFVLFTLSVASCRRSVCYAPRHLASVGNKETAMRIKVIVGLLAAVLCTSTFGAESVPLIDLHPGLDGTFVEGNFDTTVGWTFYVEEPITVTHVGWYDEDGDGLSHDHRIGLWKDLSGEADWPYVGVGNVEQLLGYHIADFLVPVGITISSGTSAELDGPWRKVELDAPLTLPVGGYALGGLDNSLSTDPITYVLDIGSTNDLESSLPADTRIRVGAPGLSFEPGFNVPDYFFLVCGLELGPMLFVQPVPEPGTSALLALGACIALCLQRNRKSR